VIDPIQDNRVDTARLQNNARKLGKVTWPEDEFGAEIFRVKNRSKGSLFYPREETETGLETVLTPERQDGTRLPPAQEKRDRGYSRFLGAIQESERMELGNFREKLKADHL
jgi:hypothetical protein